MNFFGNTNNQYLLFYKQKIGTDLMCNKGTDLGADMLAISPTAAKTARARWGFQTETSTPETGSREKGLARGSTCSTNLEIGEQKCGTCFGESGNILGYQIIIVRYKGDYLNGIKQGKGIFWWTTGPHAGERYEGDFMHDRSAWQLSKIVHINRPNNLKVYVIPA